MKAVRVRCKEHFTWEHVKKSSEEGWEICHLLQGKELMSDWVTPGLIEL